MSDTSRIAIPAHVLDEIEQIWDAGICKMDDIPSVIDVATDAGFYELVNWLTDDENRRLYVQGVRFSGFEPEG